MSGFDFNTATFARDFSPTGLKLEGGYENDRNSVYSPLYKAMIREAFNCGDVICGHHLIYVARDQRPDGFVYETVQEIPSADALLFDHCAMRKLFGDDYKFVMYNLALERTETRDELAAEYFWHRACDLSDRECHLANEMVGHTLS
jgi:hypothetical protein